MKFNKLHYRFITAPILRGFFLLFIFSFPVFSQTIVSINSQSKIKLLNASGSFQDTIRKDTLKSFRMKKDPWKAVLYSAVIPGAGQFYTKNYWKIPVIAVIGGYFGYEFFKNNNTYKDFRDKYAVTVTNENPNGDQSLKRQRDFYRDQRDSFAFYFALLYVANLVDAYIDAHLYDFDVSKSIRMGIFEKGKILNLKIKF
jgi:TM2 domain-containing membrane protein YozV